MSFILDALRKAESKNRATHEISVPQGPHIVDDESLVHSTNWPRVLVLGIASVAFIGLGLLIGSTISRTPKAPLPNKHSEISYTQGGGVTSSSSRESDAFVLNSEDHHNNSSGSTMLDSDKIVPTIRDTNTRALDVEVRKATPAPKVIAQKIDSMRGGNVTIMPAVSEPNDETEKRAHVGTVIEETLPDYRSVLTTGNVPLPNLHLDMHVYSEQIEKRFVFINLNKYKQGDNIDTDTLIESIRNDGAVINHKGYRFVLLPE